MFASWLPWAFCQIAIKFSRILELAAARYALSLLDRSASSPAFACLIAYELKQLSYLITDNPVTASFYISLLTSTCCIFYLFWLKMTSAVFHFTTCFLSDVFIPKINMALHPCSLVQLYIKFKVISFINQLPFK